MHPAPWFPIPVTREDSPTAPDELSDRDFRIAFQSELMRIFFAEIRKLTRPGNDKELFARLGIDVNNKGKLADWYARARGERLPRPSVINPLREQVPGLRLELHHPMLRWLSKPKLDERSVRRLKALMPESCVTLIESLKKLKAHELTISLGLYERLNLHEMRYLDALFAFAYARNGVHDDHEKIEQLNRILWALPIVYPDDPLWIGSSDEQHSILAGIDYALGLIGSNSPSEKWRGSERTGLIAEQLWHTAQRREKHPRALGTALTRGRYWAKVWRWRGT
jgi:hypothetical protein